MARSGRPTSAAWWPPSGPTRAAGAGWCCPSSPCSGRWCSTCSSNIRYARLDAGDEECIAAAKAASAHSFISTLPQGYETVLAGGGSNLSQGQRRLITIARIVLADRPVLILDEATSSVDTRTERKLQEALATMMRGRTSFVIAHRLSTIRDADVIVAIAEGRVVDVGSHDELMAAGGFYHDLYMSQFRGDATPTTV